MRTRVMLMAIVSTFGLTTAASAQEPLRPAAVIDPLAGLGLDQAIAQALEREPSLRASRTEVDVARGMRTQAGLRPNPTVSVSQLDEPAGTDRQTRADVMWPLELFRRGGRVALADREIDVARTSVVARERQLAGLVRARYGEVALAVRELVVLDDLVGAASSQHALVEARVEQGATPRLELDVLTVDLQRLTSERLIQSGAVERALIQLKQVLGMPIDVPLSIRDTLEQLVGPGTVSAAPGAGAPALETRPDVAVAQARVQAAEARVEQARREGGVDVSLFGMYMRSDAGFPQRGFAPDGGLEPVRSLFHYVAAGATVTLPLSNRNQGAVAAAQAKRAAAAADLDTSRIAAQAEIASARVRDAYARRALHIYTADTRALAKQNLTVVSRTYDLGRATVFDVLAEQRRYLDVERGFTMALREAYEAQQALRLALGDGR